MEQPPPVIFLVRLFPDPCSCVTRSAFFFIFIVVRRAVSSPFAGSPLTLLGCHSRRRPRAASSSIRRAPSPLAAPASSATFFSSARFSNEPSHSKEIYLTFVERQTLRNIQWHSRRLLQPRIGSGVLLKLREHVDK